MRGDLIHVFRVLKGFSYQGSGSLVQRRVMDLVRGNGCRLEKQRARLNIRANSLACRVVNSWNKLPTDVVSALTVTQFKLRLDAAWRELFPDLI